MSSRTLFAVLLGFLLALIHCGPPEPPNLPRNSGANAWDLDEVPPTTTDCMASCAADAPFCDARLRRCVACTRDSHCGLALPVCDVRVGQCVGCVSDVQCYGDRPICDARSSTCTVRCVVDADCDADDDDPSFCESDSGHCLQCRDDDDCDDHAMCAANGQCLCDVEQSGEDHHDCSDD